ncbi:MAG: lipid A deacylase LpxR family protein [Planctomycetota bacterium]
MTKRSMLGAVALLFGATTQAQIFEPLSYQAETPETDAIGQAQEAEASTRRLKLTQIWDNDSRTFQLFGQTDRYYTNGLEINLSLGAEPEGTTLDRVLRFIPALGYDIKRTAFGVSFGQEIYTPANIESEAIQIGDRPFAGFAYIALDFQRADNNMLESFRFKFGATGDISGAEASQEFVHAALIDQVDPGGWGNQIDEQFAGELDYRRVWRTFSEPIGDSDWLIQFLPEAGTRLGNTRVDARIGATARVGFNLPDDFGPTRRWGVVDHGGSSIGDRSLYFFGRVGGEYVAHDLFIDGNTDATNNQTEILPLVGEFSAGIRYRWKSFESGWQYTIESRRFRDQQTAHSYGSWVIGWAFDY